MTWHAVYLLHISPDTFWAFLIAAAPLSSDVATTAAFPLLVLSQHHVSRHGISEGRHVTIVEEEGEGEGESHELPAVGSGRAGCVSAPPSIARSMVGSTGRGSVEYEHEGQERRVGWRREAGQRPTLGAEVAAQQARRGSQLGGKRKRGKE
jgi:hypothetical protein